LMGADAPVSLYPGGGTPCCNDSSYADGSD
jgi:hypothetical protein